ncbi:unnamed protein product [Pieris macdunnoughi]|uniref:Uncharacterized protein n=1 Tax=Pieris macdunnoughi TaxID=345717 RepID=A0A821R645_9NEOP|nr:unnamed protein product [Pieris macdunnoughi]
MRFGPPLSNPNTVDIGPTLVTIIARPIECMKVAYTWSTRTDQLALAESTSSENLPDEENKESSNESGKAPHEHRSLCAHSHRYTIENESARLVPSRAERAHRVSRTHRGNWDISQQRDAIASGRAVEHYAL